MRINEDLKSEYIMLQGMYEDFDKRALSLKALITPLLSAGVIVGLKEKSFAIHVVTIMAALSLWGLEGQWKCFQYSFVDRIREIEAWYRGERDEDGLPAFQVYGSWVRSWDGWYHRPRIWLKTMMEPFVMLPYGVIVAVSMIAAGIAIMRSPVACATDHIYTVQRAGQIVIGKNSQAEPILVRLANPPCK